MLGKRLLDLAALANASRGVAGKHIALRARQIDVYNRTSTLARAARAQTDRVTETVKAASFLASRLNESGPQWDDTPAERRAGRSDRYERSSYTVGDEGLKHDNVEEKPSREPGANKPALGELQVKQEPAQGYPLPDGTLPPIQYDSETKPVRASSAKQDPQWSAKSYKNARGPSEPENEFSIPQATVDGPPRSNTSSVERNHDADVFYEPSKHASSASSSLPTLKIPKSTSTTQETSDNLGGGLNPDTFYQGHSTEHQEVSAQPAVAEDIPEGINTDIFYSPRVAHLLGGKSHSSKRDLHLDKAAGTPLDHTGLSEGRDQDTFNVLGSSQEKVAFRTPLEETQSNLQQSFINNKPEVSKSVSQAARSNVEETSDAVMSSQAQADHSPSNSTPYELRESKVPSSRLGRLWNYSGLAAGMFGGAINEGLRRVSGSGGEGSYMLSAANMDRLVAKLSRMRGAALKLGQMISFQDSKMIPAPIREVLQRVQDRADYMPSYQRDKVLSSNLGSEWRELFSTFDEKPLAAASIGQVHSAVLKSTGAKVAVKIQYPGVADSIDSDLNNLSLLLTASRLLPKGLFLDKTIENARTELAWECDYIREAECGRRFQELLADEKGVFLVPKVFPEASGKQVLTMEFMDGIGVTRFHSFSQAQKDWIGTQILRLCLREITEFRFMQTDPNWTNFLYNAETNKLELLDFGASREYPEEFIVTYSKLLAAASKSDRKSVRDLSIKLGYLTGSESATMLDAHLASVLTLAEPFLESSPDVYDFQDQTITERVKALIPVMIKERLAPPPEETYSLHRKLSGAFLLCARLGSRVRCKEMFQHSMKKANLI